MRLNLRAAGDVRWNLVYTFCANELILGLSESWWSREFSSWNGSCDVEFDGRCESMEGRGGVAFVPNVERNFIGVKKFLEMAIVRDVWRYRYVTMSVSDYIFDILRFECRINIANLLIVRWSFARIYKDIGVRLDRVVIEHRKHTPSRPTPNQCETRCNLQGFGYVTVDELV